MIEVVDITRSLRLDERARQWCTLPYPNHPHGCPNYDRRDSCPPVCQSLDEVFDLGKHLDAVVIGFDIKGHAAEMKRRHPGWTERQCRNPLYWQGHLRKQLRDFCGGQVALLGDSYTYAMCPEAMGVNVIVTLKSTGHPIKARPTNTVYKVAFLGSKARKSGRDNILDHSASRRYHSDIGLSVPALEVVED